MERVRPLARLRARQAVEAILSDDHCAERGLEGLRAVTDAALADAGIDGLLALAEELSLTLAEALERIAGEQGLAAVDIADAWFVE